MLFNTFKVTEVAFAIYTPDVFPNISPPLARLHDINSAFVIVRSLIVETNIGCPAVKPLNVFVLFIVGLDHVVKV